MLPDDVQIVSVDDHVIEHPNVWQDRLPAKYREAGPRNVRDDAGARRLDVRGSAPLQQRARCRGRKGPRGVRARPGPLRATCCPAAMTRRHASRTWTSTASTPSSASRRFAGFAGSTFYAAEDKELATRVRVSATTTGSSTSGAPRPLSGRSRWCWCRSGTWSHGGGDPSGWPPRAPRPSPSPRCPTPRDCRRSTRPIGTRSSPLPRRRTCRCACTSDRAARPTWRPTAPFTAAIALFGLNTDVHGRAGQLPHLRAVSRASRSPCPRAGSAGCPTSSSGPTTPGSATAVTPAWQTPAARRRSSATTSSAASSTTRLARSNIDLIGEDNIMFESDYPHSDSNWPHTRKMLAESLVDVPDEVARKIAETNARKLYNFPRS